MIFVAFSLRRYTCLINSKKLYSSWFFSWIIIKALFPITFWDPVANLIWQSRILVCELLRAFFSSSSFFFGPPSGVTGQSEAFWSRDATRWRVNGLDMLTSFSTFVFLEFLHCTSVWLESLAIVEIQFEQIFKRLGKGFDDGRPCLRFFFAIIEKHLCRSFSLLYKFCTNKCLKTLTQPFLPDHKLIKQKLQILQKLHLYGF